MSFTVAIPESVTSEFIVATAEPPADPAGWAREYLARRAGAELRQMVYDVLHSSMLRISTSEVHCDVAGVAIAIADSAEVAARLARATHHIRLTCEAPPLAQPEHAQAVRAIARGLALVSDGVIVDVCSKQVLPYDYRDQSEHPEFCLGDDWLAIFMTSDVRSAGGLAMQTAGLHRFGLPELVADGVPAGCCLSATSLLRALAQRLLIGHWKWLAESPGEPARRLERSLWVSGADYWDYWAVDPGKRALYGVQVQLDRRPGTPSYAAGSRDESLEDPPLRLRAGPGETYPGSLDGWWRDVVLPAMPHTLAAPRAAA